MGRVTTGGLLTTYETLKNYQHSFRQIDFSAVVFDEIQKIKNVQTLVSLSARSVKADFRIGLTGTPIENHVVDLWAIMDAVVPGRLGTLKGVHRALPHRDRNQYARTVQLACSRSVKNGDRCYPPCAQRRFKDDEIEDLPRKSITAHTPSRCLTLRLKPTKPQGVISWTARAERRSNSCTTFGRSHSILNRQRLAQSDMETYFARSARFEAVRRILESIREKGERALIYTEDRRMQAFVSQWLRSEFGLNAVSIINGATSITKRQRHVKRFQAALGNGRRI